MTKLIAERRGAVCEIRLNRPEVLNAVDRETIAAFSAAAAEAADDRNVRVVLLRGEGAHFCAGGDIGMFGELVRLPADERRRQFYRTVDMLHPLLVRLRHMPKPVVAAVQGAAAGVGLSFVLAADLAAARASSPAIRPRCLAPALACGAACLYFALRARWPRLRRSGERPHPVFFERDRLAPHRTGR
jgi:enoyl-CoA hydratase/carnithine racemase